MSFQKVGNKENEIFLPNERYVGLPGHNEKDVGEDQFSSRKGSVKKES